MQVSHSKRLNASQVITGNNFERYSEVSLAHGPTNSVLDAFRFCQIVCAIYISFTDRCILSGSAPALIN
jgi:hypothetical protein